MNPMVGIDVAKNSVVVAVCGTREQVVAPPWQVANDADTLHTTLQQLQQQHGSGLGVCCESTSYYHYTLVRACTQLGIPCLVLNPIVTKQATKATIRGKKTDPSDAVLIARLGLRGEGCADGAGG
jgi:transposase